MHICMRDIRNDGVAHDWGGVIHSAVLYYADMLCYSPQAQRPKSTKNQPVGRPGEVVPRLPGASSFFNRIFRINLREHNSRQAHVTASQPTVRLNDRS